MKKILLSLLLSAGLIGGFSSDSTLNQSGVIVHVSHYSPYPYALYPNYFHPDGVGIIVTTGDIGIIGDKLNEILIKNP